MAPSRRCIIYAGGGYLRYCLRIYIVCWGRVLVGAANELWRTARAQPPIFSSRSIISRVDGGPAIRVAVQPGEQQRQLSSSAALRTSPSRSETLLPLSLQLKEAFSLLDTDGDGILTSNDVQVNMRCFACDRRRYTLCFAPCSCSSPALITPSTSTK